MIVKLVDPSIVLLEDPTDEDSRGIVGRLSATVYFTQDTEVRGRACMILNTPILLFTP